MYLSNNKIQYVLFHLKQHISGEVLENDFFVFVKEDDIIPETIRNKVVFVLSDCQRPGPVLVNFMQTELPVLFPLKTEGRFIYRVDGRGNLIFGYDLVSSVFYLLSGQQETEGGPRDLYGRFSYDFSLQKKLGCVHLPLVNYYFEMIIQGLEVFTKAHKFSIDRRRLFTDFGFSLSHDVDRVRFHHPVRVLYRMKQIIGLAPLNYSRSNTIKLFFKGVLFNLNPFSGEDPWWNFDWMTDLEKCLGIRSAFFFLKQEDRFDNSLYKFHFKKIRSLVKRLKDDCFEVGLHGTMRSAIEKNSLKKQKRELGKVLGTEPVGIRQHYLRFFCPQTFKLQQSVGLKYDTSLAFAEHDGYRNGYCYPFHPYDFENDRMMKIWEIPLVMMEVSVLQYRKADFQELRNAVMHYIAEAQKFGGIFSLLWHNCRLSEYEYGGVREFYESLLKEIVAKKPDVMSGAQIINRLSE
jgi:hypothetical protein